VLHRWARWTADAPDSATTSFRIQRVPATASVPPALRGRRLALVAGALLDDDDRAQRLLAPLRELRPEIDTFVSATAVTAATAAASTTTMTAATAGAATTAAAVAAVGLVGDRGLRDPAPVIADSVLLSWLPPAAVDAFVAAAGPGSGSTHDLVELRHLGGALARLAPDAGALALVDGQFLVVTSTVADTVEARRRGRSEARGIVTAMSPYSGGSQCLNFATRRVDVSAAYRPEDWSRLRAVRRAVDPAELLVANHPVPPG
jgi:hypothetical protein